MSLKCTLHLENNTFKFEIIVENKESKEGHSTNNGIYTLVLVIQLVSKYWRLTVYQEITNSLKWR